MAPLKRGFELITDEVLEYDFTDSVEVSLIDSICSPTQSKRMKFGGNLSTSPKSCVKMELSSYLDFNSEYDPVVPSASDLVSSKAEAWLSDSIPGSPVADFHELPDSDSDTDIKPSLFDLEGNDSENPTDDYGDMEDFDLDVPLGLASEIIGDALSTSSLLLGVMDLSTPIDTSSLNAPISAPKCSPITVTIPASTIIPKKEPMVNIPSCNISTTSTAKKPTTTRIYDSSSSMSSFTPSMTDENKSISSRWAHNSTERKRRCEIRRLFSGLRDLFPDLHGDDRTSNINTLNRAISCVAELSRKQIENEAAIRLLRERNSMLKARNLKSQRSRLGSSVGTTSAPLVSKPIGTSLGAVMYKPSSHLSAPTLASTLTGRIPTIPPTKITNAIVTQSYVKPQTTLVRPTTVSLSVPTTTLKSTYSPITKISTSTTPLTTSVSTSTPPSFTLPTSTSQLVKTPSYVPKLPYTLPTKSTSVPISTPLTTSPLITTKPVTPLNTTKISPYVPTTTIMNVSKVSVPTVTTPTPTPTPNPAHSSTPPVASPKIALPTDTTITTIKNCMTPPTSPAAPTTPVPTKLYIPNSQTPTTEATSTLDAPFVTTATVFEPNNAYLSGTKLTINLPKGTVSSTAAFVPTPSPSPSPTPCTSKFPNYFPTISNCGVVPHQTIDAASICDLVMTHDPTIINDPAIVNDPTIRKALPSALRQLLDHNSRGSTESKPLPPRRKTVRKL
eukprot:m.256092 g.256092  ORF g.256092 m.256092 type:complete len:728 (+) comp34054_c1_seq1:282-2465(+)